MYWINSKCFLKYAWWCVSSQICGSQFYFKDDHLNSLISKEASIHKWYQAVPDVWKYKIVLKVNNVLGFLHLNNAILLFEIIQELTPEWSFKACHPNRCKSKSRDGRKLASKVDIDILHLKYNSDDKWSLDFWWLRISIKSDQSHWYF